MTDLELLEAELSWVGPGTYKEQAAKLYARGVRAPRECWWVAGCQLPRFHSGACCLEVRDE